MRRVRWVGAGLAACWALSCVAEDLDLTKVRAVDWALVENGAEREARFLLAPTDDPKELAGLLKKLYGVRLSSEDHAHSVVLALGLLPAGAEVLLKRATIDRFRHLVELGVLLKFQGKDAARRPEPPAGAGKEAETAESIVIGPARIPPPANPFARPPPALPPAVAAQTKKEGENPVLFIPAGPLEPGTWWVRLLTTVEEGEARTEHPARSDSFQIKDNRPYKRGEKGRNTPSAGLEPPSSPSVTSGLGGP